MDDEDEQDQEGDSSGDDGGDGGSDSGSQDKRGRQDQQKSPLEKANDARKKIQKAKRDLDRLKKGADKLGKGAKKLADPAIKAGQQAAMRAAARIAQIATKVAADVAAKASQAASKVAQVAVKLLTNPYVLAAVLIIVLVMVLFNIFMGSVNGISSMAGGSVLVPADYNNPVHQQLVERLKQKMDGCDPKLVMYEGGADDIDWQSDPNTGARTHRLDIRVLKTLDYLTDKHRIRIDLLKTGAPDIIRDSFLKKMAGYSPTGLNELEQKETLSAFTTGQAMAIVQIDRTKIPELQSADMACGVPVPVPIDVGWQKTVGEKTLRPIWEELAYSVGYLDKNLPIYEGITARNDQAAIKRVAQAYKLSEPVDGAYDIFKETFRKLPRIVELIDRALAYGQKKFEGEQAIDARALADLQKARDNYALAVGIVSGANAGMSDEELANIIALLGTPENIAKLRTGARFAYKATQVKNSVNWDKPKKNGDLTWVKASESRNKIRQVIKELLEMPRETSLEGAPVLFDENLVIKQIVTFSPEDDLDNGLENLDVFPRGMVAVDDGGVAMEPLLIDEETGNAVGDGRVDVADYHFSHSPLDNGVFSKNGTNYVYKQVKPGDSGWEKAGTFIWNYLTMPGQLLSASDKLHDLLVGGCVADLNETCRKVSYRDFLQVAF